MSEDRRRALATATVGYGGVGTAAALRHSALNRSYGKQKRPTFFAERSFIRHARGRNRYLTGAGLALLTAPAAVKGTNDLLTKRHSFVVEGVGGARDALTDRGRALQQKRPPAKLAASNYLTGLGISAAGGGAAHLLMRRSRLPGGAEAAIASSAGLLAGAASLPAQRKHIERRSRGRYTVTPTGLQRREPVTKLDPGANLSRGKRRALVTASGGAPVIGDFTQAAAAARLAPAPYRHRTAVEQYTGNQAGALTGTAAGTAGALALAHHSPRFNSGAQRASDKVDQVKAKARSAVHLPEAGKPMGARVLEHPRTPPAARRIAAAVGRSAPARAIARNPKVAAIGALGGSMVGGQIGAQMTYSRIMSRDDRYRRANPAASHGSRVTKRDASKPLTRRDEKELSRRKRRGAVMSTIGGATGIGALTALGASKLHPKLRPLGRAQTPLLTIGAGVGGINAFNFAHVQRKEAQRDLAKRDPGAKLARITTGAAGKYRTAPLRYPVPRKLTEEGEWDRELHQRHKMIRRWDGRGVNEDWWTAQPQRRIRRQFGKSFGLPRVPRTPGMRRGFLRQTRTTTGIKVSSVRGGLIR